MDLGTRPLRRDDARAALSLLSAYDRRHFGEPVLTLADLESTWAAPGFSFHTDSEAYVDADDQLVAFGTLDEHGSIELGVADDWAGAGLEDVLAARWEAEAATRGYPSVHRYVADADREGAAGLRARGYDLHHTAWVLALDSDDAVTARTLPAGYAVRPMTEADARGVHALVTEAFGEWGAVPRSYPTWRAQLVDRPDVDLGHARVATCAGVLVGACLVIDPDPREPAAARPEVWVPQLAVHRDHRRRGVAQQLLAEAYGAARARGVPSGALSTDTRTGALELYRRLGMRVRHTVQCYQLDLDPDLDRTG